MLPWLIVIYYIAIGYRFIQYYYMFMGNTFVLLKLNLLRSHNQIQSTYQVSQHVTHLRIFLILANNEIES